MTTEEKANREEWEALLSDWKNAGVRLEATLDDFNRMVSGSPESPLHDAIWTVFDRYTEALSLIVGDNEEWLGWFRHECDFGRKPREMSFSDGEKLMVVGVGDLIDAIDTLEDGNRKF
jgi:hypothetical protein